MLTRLLRVCLPNAAALTGSEDDSDDWPQFYKGVHGGASDNADVIRLQLLQEARPLHGCVCVCQWPEWQ